MYSSFAQKLFVANTPHEASKEIGELTEKLRDRVPSIEEFAVAFKEVNFTNTNSKQKNLVRYILRKFSEHHKYRYPVDYDELTIEHLHSQSDLNSRWTLDIVGSLGNLIFVDEDTNGKLGTKPYKEKKKILSDSNYSLPTTIRNTDKLTPKLVIENTEYMAEIAYKKIWKI